MSEPDFLSLTRNGYDRTAKSYAERFHHHLDGKPVDRAMLAAFAGLVTTHTNRHLADVGCGTGATTAILRDLGLQPFGIDLSHHMVEQAQLLHPGIDFTVGSMTDLEVPNESVGGVCAWYSIIHIPDDHLPQVLAEFDRILASGGWVLLTFQVGDRPRILTTAFGEPVELTFHRRSPEAIEALLEDSGLLPYARLVRQPDDDGFETTPHAYLIARKAQ